MRSGNLLLVGLTCLTVQAQSPALVGYWHNWSNTSAPYIELDQIDPRYNVIEVAFAEPAVGSTFDIQFTPVLTPPATFTAQVAAHQAMGHKVLISIGGANATVHLTSDPERDQFVSSMTAIIDTYGFDGIDIDLEGSSVSITGGSIANPIDASVIRLIDAIHSIADQFALAHGVPMMLTMAPETAYVQGGMSAFGGIWGAYLPIIDALRDRIDILQVQLYNSGSMYGIDGGIYAQGTADFIVSQTEAVIQGFTTGGGDFQGLEPEQVAVALPACASAAGGGYTDTTTVRMAMEYLMGTGPQPGSYALQQSGGYPTLRGMMTWSINWDAASACNGTYSYAETFERIFGDIGTGVQGSVLNRLSVAPNPATDRLILGAAMSTPCVLAITEHSGRLVRREPLPAGRQEILVSELPAGSYLLTLNDGRMIHQARFVRF